MKCKATQYVCFQSSVIGERLDLPYFLAPPQLPQRAAPRRRRICKKINCTVHTDSEAKNTSKYYKKNNACHKEKNKFYSLRNRTEMVFDK